MAISDSFNLARALDSQAYAYKCWYNYQYGNNTMGISSKDMNEIRQTWSSELANWQATALDDENAYVIEDDDFSRACKNGKEQGEDKSGHDGSNPVASNIGDALGSATGAAGTTISVFASRAAFGGSLMKNLTSKVVGDEATKQAGKQAAKNAKLSAYVAAGIAIATAAKYWIAKPNKDEKEACDALQDEMSNAEAATSSAKDSMQKSRSAIEDLTSEAEDTKDMVHEDIGTEMAEVDLYKASYDAIVASAASRGGLTEEEKAEVVFYQAKIQGIAGEKGSIQLSAAEASELVGDIYDDMGTHQDVFDESAETVAEVQGLTDFAESFDKATQTSCYIQAGAQTLNATSGAIAGAKLLAGGPWNWALGIAAIVAGGSSGIAATQQMSWAGEVGNEIEMRKMAQKSNALTNDIYDESIQDYEGAMVSVENMTVAIPESIEELELPKYVVDEGEEGPVLPTVTTTAATTGATAGATTGTTSTRSASTDPTNTDDKKDDKKDKNV